MGSNREVLSSDRDGSNPSRPASPSQAPTKKGTGDERRSPKRARQPKLPAIKKSFCCVELWPIVIADAIPILVVGKELGQRSDFTILLLRRRNVDETQRLRQPAGIIEKTLGLLGHIGLLQMVDQLRGRLTLCFPNRFEDAGFCDPAEIVADRRSPSHSRHVESDGPRQDIRVIKPGANAVSRDTALIIAVSRLIERVHRK